MEMENDTNKSAFAKRFAPIILILATAFVVAGGIYLTPLKHFNIIEPRIEEIDPAELYELLSTNPEDYRFIDVRPDRFYNTAHAEGSENIMLHLLYFERHNLPKDKTTVLICAGEESPSSGVAYSYLEHYGFPNLLRVKGGIEAWEAAGLPIVRGVSFSE